MPSEIGKVIQHRLWAGENIAALTRSDALVQSVENLFRLNLLVDILCPHSLRMVPATCSKSSGAIVFRKCAIKARLPFVALVALASAPTNPSLVLMLVTCCSLEFDLMRSLAVSLALLLPRFVHDVRLPPPAG